MVHHFEGLEPEKDKTSVLRALDAALAKSLYHIHHTTESGTPSRRKSTSHGIFCDERRPLPRLRQLLLNGLTPAIGPQSWASHEARLTHN
jgi:hypothetical protein